MKIKKNLRFYDKWDKVQIDPVFLMQNEMC